MKSGDVGSVVARVNGNWASFVKCGLRRKEVASQWRCTSDDGGNQQAEGKDKEGQSTYHKMRNGPGGGDGLKAKVRGGACGRR